MYTRDMTIPKCDQDDGSRTFNRNVAVWPKFDVPDCLWYFSEWRVTASVLHVLTSLICPHNCFTVCFTESIVFVRASMAVCSCSFSSFLLCRTSSFASRCSFKSLLTDADCRSLTLNSLSWGCKWLVTACDSLSFLERVFNVFSVVPAGENSRQYLVTLCDTRARAHAHTVQCNKCLTNWRVMSFKINAYLNSFNFTYKFRNTNT